MVTDSVRRRLLRGALGGLALAPLSGVLGGCSQSRSSSMARHIDANTHTKTHTNRLDVEQAIIGCSRYPNGQFGAVVATPDGHPVHQFDLPARGHGIAVQTEGSLAAAFSRRPGTYLQVFDYRTGETWPLRLADQNRYYYGHGVFSPDGRLLYATEGKTATSEGVIGVYELEPSTTSHPIKKVAEFTGFGIGPHEVILVDDNTLAIGVGGVHTRGRTPLNIETMQPALVYLDRRSGELVEQAELADKRLSIRHLSLTDTGEVACGQQYRGEPEGAVPLVALHRRGGRFESLIAEDEEWLRFNHYIASISSLDGYLLATSPRGNCYGIWRASSRELVSVSPLIDASGVGVLDNRWLVGSGAGKVVSVKPPANRASFQGPVMWDNHWNIINTPNLSV
ncbi:DUF1513 domain-containing protein [Photobacterium sanctipauli]|uniref:DUF1513 domain-containing protein n=3 Tax=Photobacterium sanctipauli TaxID=1342794 RepID=A0A2T3NZ43_9GAMM|nr:DUF1513 domain-containing protein [Photobacterium sanctipauli]PSW21543.1 DUF1513 domain-containing protein [Photobacterium sanctipauli]